MRKFVSLILSVVLCQALQATQDQNVDARIQQLEAELKKLKQKTVKVPQPVITKKQSLRKNDFNENSVDLIEEDDLSDLAPLEDNVSKQKIIQLKTDTKKIVKKEPVNESKLDQLDRALELYEQAKVMLGQKKLDQAQQIFQEIITAYPESPYYIIAQYWCGELAYNKQDYMNASLAYGKIFEKYKAGKVGHKFKNRVAESLIKFAHCLKMLKKNAECCVILDEFNKEFKSVPRNIQKFAAETRTLTSCPKK